MRSCSYGHLNSIQVKWKEIAKLLSHIRLFLCHYLLGMSSSAEALTLTGALMLPCGSTYWLPVCGLDASWADATWTQTC